MDKKCPQCGSVDTGPSFTFEPTYRTRREDPSTGRRQLGFVFASESIADSLTVRALNGRDEWGPSDHCRIAIDLSD